MNFRLPSTLWMDERKIHKAFLIFKSLILISIHNVENSTRINLFGFKFLSTQNLKKDVFCVFFYTSFQSTAPSSFLFTNPLNRFFYSRYQYVRVHWARMICAYFYSINSATHLPFASETVKMLQAHSKWMRQIAKKKFPIRFLLQTHTHTNRKLRK